MFLSMITSILVFLIVLSILVIVHELGHFIMARRAGVKVEEFGFGLPPRIWGKQIGETLYSINALPFGGFVRLYGESDEGKDATSVSDCIKYVDTKRGKRVAIETENKKVTIVPRETPPEDEGPL